MEPELELHSIKETTNMTTSTGHGGTVMNVSAAELVSIECEAPTSLFDYMKNTGQILACQPLRA